MGDEVLNSCPTRDVESLKFLFGFASRDPNTRRQALDNVQTVFENWLDGCASPVSYTSPSRLATDNNSNGIKEDNTNELFPNGFITDFKLLVKEQMPDILRLSRLAPFADVRESCDKILSELEDRGMKRPRLVSGPSKFIPIQDVCAVDTEDDEVQSQFVDAFVHNNRLEHIVQVMGYHPQYLDCFLKTQQYILRGDGPLPYAYRHYIAIMAAGRHQCSYLINIQSAEFLLQGGNPKWLNGLDHIPKKLRDLYEFNKVMAHRPWLISKSHIENLTRGNDNWSMSELMHAVIILAHFHALSSFVYGCGISAEIDHSEGHTFRPPSLSASPVNGSPPLNNHSNTSSSMEECGIETLMERMKRLNEETEEPSEEELLQRFKKVETQSAELPAATQQPSPKADILRYVTEADFTYQDFAKRSQVSELPTFKAQDYSWDDHGFSLANRLYTDIGNLLDDKFKIAYNLTYYTMGDNHDVDTSSFRRAIWYYIHCMYGIRHDDYDYSEVNHLLERNLKAYVKTTTCYPERVTKKHYESFMREFKHSEKVHVNLMVFEARLQAELLYALRAITRHMT